MDKSENVFDQTTNLAFVRMLWRHKGQPGMLIPILQAAQDSYGYIPQMVIEQISDVTGIPASEIYGVITFYRQFRLSPPGKHILRLCKGTACHVQGVKTIGQLIEEELGISAGDTTKDGVFSYEEVACLGCCSLAPVMMIDDNTYGRLTAKSLRKILRSYRKKALQISA